MDLGRRRWLLKMGCTGATSLFAGCTTGGSSDFSETETRRNSATDRETATEDPAATVLNSTISDDPAQAGAGIPITVKLRRETDAKTTTLRVSADGEPVLSSVDGGPANESHSLSLTAGESTTLEVQAWLDTPGQHEIVVNGTPVGSVSVEDNWLQLQYDSSHTGRPEAKTAPKDGVTEAWRGGMASIAFGFSPVVVGKRAFLNVGHPGLRQTFDEQDMGGLLRYDLESQNDTHLKRPGMVMNSPVVCQGTVVAATYDGSLDSDPAETEGALVGYGLEGLESWEAPLDSGAVSGVTSDGRSVYVATFSGVVTAHEPRTGAERWRTDSGAMVTATPAVADETVYVGDNDGTVHALSVDDGSRQWSASVPNAIDAAPTVVDDTLYVPSHDPHDKAAPGGQLAAISLPEGEPRWQRRTDKWMGTSVVTDGDSLFAGVGRSLWAIDPADGTVRWKGPTATGAQFPTEGEPAVLDGTVYAVIGHDEGTVFALDGSDGSVQWRYNNGVTLTSVAIADGDVLVGSQGEDAWDTSVNKVVALRESDG